MNDRWLKEIGEKLKCYINFKNGIYIELGAYDGLRMSNTKWLEDELGWKGILVEPSIVRYKECLKNRKNNKIFNCVCTNLDYKNNVIRGDFNGSPMDSVGGVRKNKIGNIEVSARSLQSIINESGYKDIDFLSVDVEGYELEVLKGIDFTHQDINYILIEIYNKDKDTIFSFMENRGYVLVENISNFTKKTHPNWDGTHNDYLFKIKG